MGNDDGFWHRILINCPSPAKFTAEQIRSAPKPQVSMTAILFFIRALHEQTRHYAFHESTMLMVDAFFNEVMSYVSRSNRFDTFLR